VLKQAPTLSTGQEKRLTEKAARFRQRETRMLLWWPD